MRRTMRKMRKIRKRNLHNLLLMAMMMIMPISSCFAYREFVLKIQIIHLQNLVLKKKKKKAKKKVTKAKKKKKKKYKISSHIFHHGERNREHIVSFGQNPTAPDLQNLLFLCFLTT